MIRFRHPLRMNQVEDIIERSIFGTGSGDLLKVHQAPIIRPKGGSLYLCSSSLHSFEDGYNWTEVSKQVSQQIMSLLDSVSHFYNGLW